MGAHLDVHRPREPRRRAPPYPRAGTPPPPQPLPPHHPTTKSAMSSLSILSSEIGHCVRLVPPQSNDDSSISVGKGAYCFVIDVSGA